jgi:hypothetical protein
MSTELTSAKQESWRKFCTESPTHTPWKLYKTCKTGFAGAPVTTSLTLLDGSVTTSEVETVCALFHKFFPDDDTAKDSDQQRDIRAQTAKTGPPNSQLEPLFSKHEVEQVISNIDAKKCPGPDSIDGVMVKRLHEHLPNFWLTLFNKCLITWLLPQGMVKGKGNCYSQIGQE